MKKLLLFICTVFITVNAFSQKNKTPQPDTALIWKEYRNAMEFSDMLVAKNALFEITAVQPGNKSVYDSLANIYFVIGAYSQAILAVEKAPSTVAMKEIKAYSYKNLGDLKTALTLFDELARETGSPENLYQLASLQYTAKRYGECMANTEKVLKNPDSATKMVIISLDNGQSMTVSYKAATENLKGAVFLDMGKPDLAKECFERALEAAPDFILAKKNLENIKMTEDKK